jgi:hypothetical protein
MYLVLALLVVMLAPLVGAGPREVWAQLSSDDPCLSSAGPVVRLPSTKFLIEHNATDEDTGVQGLFDGIDWTKLCVFDPNGQLILVVEPHAQLRVQSISGIFFESAEPPNAEVPIAKFLGRFPEGRYPVRGSAKDGRRLSGEATFTHTIPAGPQITHPLDGDTVPATGLVVMWNHSTQTITGEPFTRTGYEVIVTKDVRDDPNGFSRPTFDVHVPPSAESLTISDEFLETNTSYELEVLVLEESGNQTITGLFFRTTK